LVQTPTEAQRKVLEDGCQDGLQYTLVRGPKAAVQKTESRLTATFFLFLGLLDLGVVNACDARHGSSGDSLCDNDLLSLIAVLNRNNLVPSAAWSTERVR
jgi:hypothetical protein